MKCYSLSFCLLLYCLPLAADQFWSHIAGVGSVQLTELNPTQHQLLAEHLKLDLNATTEWLQQLPEQLDLLSCATLEQQSQTLPAYLAAGYQLISYAGILKFYSGDRSKPRIWWLPWNLLPEVLQLKTELLDWNKQLHQPLLISEAESGLQSQLIIVSGSSNSSPQYFALALQQLGEPVLLWSVDGLTQGFEDLTGAMAKPVFIPQPLSKTADSPGSVLLPNAGGTANHTLLYKVEVLTAQIQARFMAKQQLVALSGAMALYDQNRDTVPDSLLFSSKNGQLWQVQFENNQFYDDKLIADLSALNFSDIQFIHPLYAAVPVAGSGHDFHSRRSQWLVLLTALQQQQSIFLLLKPRQGYLVLAADLVNRALPQTTELALLTEQDWQQIQQKSGWYSVLHRRLTDPALVAGGVIYLKTLLLDPGQQCAVEHAAPALMALHLHHASPVYRRLMLPLEHSTGAFRIRLNAEGGFTLVDQQSQQVLIEHLLEISPDCTHCSQMMQQSNLQRWQLMGTYHSEEGAYE
jgi:hypothetical protein